jgi:hypothetical protein
VKLFVKKEPRDALELVVGQGEVFESVWGRNRKISSHSSLGICS